MSSAINLFISNIFIKHAFPSDVTHNIIYFYFLGPGSGVGGPGSQTSGYGNQPGGYGNQPGGYGSGQQDGPGGNQYGSNRNGQQSGPGGYNQSEPYDNSPEPTIAQRAIPISVLHNTPNEQQGKRERSN